MIKKVSKTNTKEVQNLFASNKRLPREVSQTVRRDNKIGPDGKVQWGVKPDTKPMPFSERKVRSTPIEFQKGVTFKEVPGGSEVSLKRQRFLDNIEQRVERALDRIRLVKQCFHPGNYDWTKEEGDKVYEALFDAVTAVANAANRKSDRKKSFTL